MRQTAHDGPAVAIAYRGIVVAARRGRHSRGGSCPLVGCRSRGGPSMLRPFRGGCVSVRRSQERSYGNSRAPPDGLRRPKRGLGFRMLLNRSDQEIALQPILKKEQETSRTASDNSSGLAPPRARAVVEDCDEDKGLQQAQRRALAHIRSVQNGPVFAAPNILALSWKAESGRTAILGLLRWG